MKPSLGRRGAALLACLLPACAAAQTAPGSARSAPTATAPGTPPPPVNELAPVVVTATRTAQPLKDVLGDVTVIGTDTLQAAGQSSLAQVLSRSHGIEYTDNGGPQAVTGLFMRGANSNQTLVLIDGQRINNASNGLAALNALPVASIERVEIVRGAASSLYGADAIGGVINIITKREAEQPLSAFSSIGYGSHGTSSYEAGLSGAAQGWRYSLSGGYEQSHGHDATNKKNYYRNPDRDTYYRSNTTASLGYEWQPGQTITGQFYRARVNAGYDNGEPYFNDRAIQRVQSYSLTSVNRLNDTWTSTLRLGSTEDDNRAENAPASVLPGSTPDGRSAFRTRQNQLLWQHDLRLHPGQTLTLAYEHLRQRASGDIANFNTPAPSFGDYAKTDRNIDSFTAVYLGDFGRHHLQASVRSDDNSQFGQHTTGSLTYGFDVTANVRASAGTSTGFRAPNFNELYWPNDGGFAGNPQLRPETSRNYEASLRYVDDDSELGVTYYHNRVRDLIINQPVDASNPFSLYRPYNVSNAVLEGVTFTAMRKFGETRVRASLDLSNPRNTDTHERLPQRSDTVLRIAADRRFGELLLGGEWYATEERTDALTGDRLGGYGLFNLLATYGLTRNLQVQMRWNNVFDRDYTLVKGYDTPGSNVYVSLTWRM